METITATAFQVLNVVFLYVITNDTVVKDEYWVQRFCELAALFSSISKTTGIKSIRKEMHEVRMTDSRPF